jgi:hypothetical protein
MTTTQLIAFVEEPSMEAFLDAYLRRTFPHLQFETYMFQGKQNLFANLENRLRALSTYIPKDCRVMVIVDRDGDDCAELKQRLEVIAWRAGFITRTTAGAAQWRLVNRIAVEELEAWYFGEWEAVHAAFPRVPTNIAGKKNLRNSDAIMGGTWETFERTLQRHGYYKTGLMKVDAARRVARHFDPARCTSVSFRALHAALREIAGG